MGMTSGKPRFQKEKVMSTGLSRPETGQATDIGNQKVAFALGTLFAVLLSIGGAGYVYLLRLMLGSESFGIGVSALAQGVLIAAAVLVLPILFGGRHGARSVTVILAILLWLAYAPGWLLAAVVVLAVLVLVVGLLPLFRLLREAGWRQVAVLAILAMIAAVILAQINIWHNYATPVSLETSLIGLAHQDTLFHAAVAQNLLSASVVSIGADGLVPLVYHVFSHRVIGGLATLFGIEVLHGYAVFVSVIGIPVMLGLLLQTAAQLHHPGRVNLAAPAAMFSVLGWLAFGGAVMWHSYYSSESYTLSLWLLLLALPLLHAFAQPDLAVGRYCAILGLLAATVALAALSKISVGAVLACAVAAGIVAAGRFRPLAWGMGAIVGLLPAVAVYLAYPITQESDASLFKPFAFLHYGKPSLYALFLALIMSFLAWRHFPREQGARSLTLALVAGMWAGLCAGFLVNAAGGSQFYFTDPGSWLGLMLIPVLGLAPKWLARRTGYAQFGIVAGFVAVMLFMNDEKLRGLDRLDLITEALAKLPEAGTLGERAVQHTATGQAMRLAKESRGMIDAIVVDADHAAFWQAQNVCWATSIVLPALVGKPMLKGIIPEGYACEISRYYGFADYDLSDGRAPAGPSAASICEVARSRALTRLLIISERGGEVVACN